MKECQLFEHYFCFLAKDAYETDLSIAAGAYECVLRCRVTVCAGIFIKTKVFNIKHDQHPIRAVMAIMGQSAYYAYLLTNVGPRYVFIPYVC